MKYGAMNHPGLPVINEIKRIAVLEFDYIEMTMDPPYAHYTTINHQKHEILTALDDHGLGLVCHLPTFVYTADLTEGLRIASVNEIKKSLEVAAELKAEKVVLHPGTPTGLGVFFPDMIKGFAFESLEIILEHAADLRIMTCIENMPAECGMFIEPDEFIEIFKRFPDIYMTFDIGHANTRSSKKERITEFIKKFKTRIKHLHISDNLGKEDDHLPLEKGTVNLKHTAQALKKINYQQTITFEVFDGGAMDLIYSKQLFQRFLET